MLHILMPVYEDRESASILFANLVKELNVPFKVIAVEDGSTVNPLAVDDLERNGVHGEIVFLARNVGHQRAIAIGLAHIAASHSPSAVIIMDSDGEDLPHAIPGLLSRVENQTFDIAVAKRARRTEGFAFRVSYQLYRRVFRLLTGRTIAHGNFTALSPKALRRLVAMQELWVHFGASIMVSRLRVYELPVDRGYRYRGSSKMNYVALVLHAMRSAMVFAEDVLVRMALLCVTLIGMTLIGLSIATGLKLFGIATPGWFTSAAGLLIVILLQSGLITLVTLMLAGLMRSQPPITQTELKTLIDSVVATSDDVPQLSKSQTELGETT